MKKFKIQYYFYFILNITMENRGLSQEDIMICHQTMMVNSNHIQHTYNQTKLSALKIEVTCNTQYFKHHCKKLGRLWQFLSSFWNYFIWGTTARNPESTNLLDPVVEMRLSPQGSRSLIMGNVSRPLKQM